MITGETKKYQSGTDRGKTFLRLENWENERLMWTSVIVLQEFSCNVGVHSAGNAVTGSSRQTKGAVITRTPSDVPLRKEMTQPVKSGVPLTGRGIPAAEMLKCKQVYISGDNASGK